MSPDRVGSDNTLVVTRFVLSAILFCFALIASARQSQYPILANADSAEVWFDKLLGPENAPIVNGQAYYIPFKGLKTHPFFQNPAPDRSFVLYDNDLYRNIDLLYDSYSDFLVYKCVTQNGTFYIKLDTKLVQRFDLHQRHFKKFEEGITAGIGAYFDVLFEENQFAVVVQRRKLQTIVNGRNEYVEDDVYYILNDGELIRMTGKGSFYKTIRKDQRKELDSFIKTNHISVGKKSDEDLNKLGAFCYSLKGSKP